MTGRPGPGAGAPVPDPGPGRPDGRRSGLFDSHLGLDAVVAYVDGELTPVAMERAGAHLVRCGQCAGEVAEQAVVARCLQAAGPLRMPGSLFEALTAIPLAMPAARALSGPAPDPTDRSGGSAPLRGSAYYPGHPAPSRRSRFGAGALVAGLAVGAAVATAATTSEHPSPPEPGAPHVRSVGPAPLISYLRH